jgi:hypothetical protein
MNPNIDWINLHKSGTVHGSLGKTIWILNGQTVTNFPLTNSELKLFRKTCKEADRVEAFEKKPVNVIISKNGYEVTMKMDSVDN